MAATPFPPPLNNPFSPFDIFNDGGAARSTPPPANPSLPGGPCNFVDLSHGPNGAKCGCRRFWGRQVAGAGNHTMDQMGWCMCSHHACFHDDVQNTQSQAMPTPVLDNLPGQENEKPRSNRMPLSPVQDFASLHMPNSLGAAAMDFATLNFDSFSSNNGLGVDVLPQANPPVPAMETDSMPDTLSWKNVPSTQGAQTPLPPIPSQCLIQPSPGASTTASSQLRYLKPFGGRGLNTLSGVPSSRTRELTREMTTTCVGSSDDHKEGQICDDAITVRLGSATPTPGSTQFKKPPHPASVASGAPAPDNVEYLADQVTNHEERLDKLETGSIYNAAHEECSDKHDMTDLRVTELESRMDDVEKRINEDAASVVSSRRTTQRDDEAKISINSGPNGAPALAADRIALQKQVEKLQAHVKHLEASSLPSYSSPWEVEVVFLPFPLKGIWLEAQDFKTPRLSAGRDEWTQMPNTNTRATPDPQIPTAYDEWAGQDSGWLLPRACVPGRLIDQRLRSRGLIKTVSVRGADARSVHLAVGNAFESALHLMPSPANPRSPYASDVRVDRFFGLQQSWVPLRKVHKDSRLRFLSPAELLTPVLWNSTFLMDSVVMKATGVHRLYITQPESYLQDSHLLSHQGLEVGWSWQKLRELARVYPESQSSTSGSEVPEADACEDCWSYNARLDEAPSARRVLVSPVQPHDRAVSVSRTSNGSTEQFFTGPSNPISSAIMSPILTRGQSPLIQRERRASRTPSIRAGSVPPVHMPAIPSPTRSLRRHASYAINPSLAGPNYQRHSSPLVAGRPNSRLSIITPAGTNPPAVAMITKHRRRSTRSPSLRLRNTPRWSTHSLSRSPSVGPFFQNLSAMYAAHNEEHQRSERRTTPFAYATPHSNAPLPDFPPPAGRALSRSHSRSIPAYEDEEDEEMGLFEDEEDEEDEHGSSTDEDIDVYQDEDEGDALDELESDSDRRQNQRPQNRHQPSLSPFPQQRQAPLISPPPPYSRRAVSFLRPLHEHQPLSAPSSSSLQQQQHLHPQPRGPEDEPLPGIEDNHPYNDDNMSDGENVDPFHNDDDDDDDEEGEDDMDARSDVSSQPSEYPSTQRAWQGPAEGREMTHGLEGEDGRALFGGIGFRIHEDEGDDAQGML